MACPLFGMSAIVRFHCRIMEILRDVIMKKEADEKVDAFEKQDLNTRS